MFGLWSIIDGSYNLENVNDFSINSLREWGERGEDNTWEERMGEERERERITSSRVGMPKFVF